VNDRTVTANSSTQVAAVRRLGFMLGSWRGSGWTVIEGSRVRFEQEESVRSRLNGEIITVDGRANDPGNRDDIRFSAFAIVSYDTAAKAYRWRAYSAGNCVEVPLDVGEQTFRWEFHPAPDTLMRFDAHVAGGSWRQVGQVSANAGTTWSQTFEMNLTRIDQRSERPL
jgi:hypothetical protein